MIAPLRYSKQTSNFGL